jgi:hypothetical protein
MKVVLAEKPSVARELASFLGARTRADGYFESDTMACTIEQVEFGLLSSGSRLGAGEVSSY